MTANLMKSPVSISRAVLSKVTIKRIPLFYPSYVTRDMQNNAKNSPQLTRQTICKSYKRVDRLHATDSGETVAQFCTLLFCIPTPYLMGSRCNVAIARFDGGHGHVPKPEDGHPCDEHWPRKWFLNFRRFCDLDLKQ